jgi:hypothetical protein
MDFEAKTIDEELTELVDTYDSFIAPKRLFRNNNNKLYLIFKSIGAGFSKIRDVVLGLKYRFDPRYCSDDDLESMMLITGEKRIGGKASMLRVLLMNTELEESRTLTAGVYSYVSTDGSEFRFTLSEDATIAPQGFEVILFASVETGAYPVSDNANAGITRSDGGKIDSAFQFQTLDNSASLGRVEESMLEVRERILSDTLRRDSLKELQTAIKSIPSIFECNLVLNPDTELRDIGEGITLEPKELLIVITGMPDETFAQTVLSGIIYKTHKITFDMVVWYYNDLFVDGRYPVYYKFHDKTYFYLTISYRFDRSKLKKEQVDAGLSLIFNKYKVMTSHVDEITEALLYKDVENSGLAGVVIRKIWIQAMENGSLVSVAGVDIPKMYLPELVSITYIAEEDV